MALTYRDNKGSALTHEELDANFRHFTGSHDITGTLTATDISASGQLYGNIVNVNTRVKAIGSTLEFAGDTLDFVDGNSTTRLFKGTAAGAFEAYHAGNKKLETTSAGIEVLGNVSGSAASTGSFGFLEASNILFESDENGDIMPL